MPPKTSDSTSWHLKRADGVYILALLAGIVVLYRGVLQLWWCLDDFYQIEFITAHPPSEYLFSPAVWQQLPTRLLTPFLFFSLDIDRHLDGLRPELFYAHQLIAFMAAMIAMYLALRPWLEPSWSAIACAIIFLGTPSSSIVQQLMQRHYAEGIIFACVTVLSFVRACRTGRVGLAVLCVGAYVAATLEKEIFVPLPLLLFALPLERNEPRRKLLWALGGALVFYSAWRYHMLGTFGGGYAWVVSPSDYPRLVMELPRKLFTALGGVNAPVVSILMLSLLAAFTVYASTRRESLWVTAMALAAAVAPIVPASTVMENRYALGISILLAVGFAVGCSRLAERGRPWRNAAVGVALAVVSLALISNRTDWRSTFSRMKQMSAEGRGFVTLGANDTLAHPRIPPAAMSQLVWMKRELHGSEGSDWYYDDIRLCTEPLASRRIWELDQNVMKLHDITPTIAARAHVYCASIRNDVPLSAGFTHQGGVLGWKLGPYEPGKYSFVLANGRVSYEMPRAQRYDLGPLPGITLRVRYESPDGWVTYSPELQLDFARQHQWIWERPGLNRHRSVTQATSCNLARCG
ncbi:MAG TPA: hypothetical protein VHL58_18035 [Thermoanaerobaculia bacterium]|nr:hypothetical protein [Thermoanaerobaculia bacterium]